MSEAMRKEERYHRHNYHVHKVRKKMTALNKLLIMMTKTVWTLLIELNKDRCCEWKAKSLKQCTQLSIDSMKDSKQLFKEAKKIKVNSTSGLSLRGPFFNLFYITWLPTVIQIGVKNFTIQFLDTYFLLMQCMFSKSFWLLSNILSLWYAPLRFFHDFVLSDAMIYLRPRGGRSTSRSILKL